MGRRKDVTDKAILNRSHIQRKPINFDHICYDLNILVLSGTIYQPSRKINELML